MITQRIAIRVDANSEIGTGHFMRCLTLADELRKAGSVVSFVVRALPSYLKQMLQDRNIDCYSLPEVTEVEFIDELKHSQWLKVSQHQDAMQTLEVLDQEIFDWLIVDHYAIDQRWESLLRDVAKKIMVIDDLADRQHDCDILLDQNYYYDMDKRYVGKVPQHCKLLLGPSYALLREEFRELRQTIKPRSGLIKNILIYFGGVDSKNYTSMALKTLIQKKWEVNVDVVIGKQHPNIQEIQDYCKLNEVTCHVQTNKMAELMANADMAICAGGASVWELFAMGLPSICISTASNQNQQITDLQGLELIISPLKDQGVEEFFSEALDEVRYDSNLLSMISKKIYEIVDANGASKVKDLISLSSIKIRLANHSDSKNVFTWRNHLMVRSNSLSKKEISWTEHERWFSQRCEEVSQPILIGEVNNKPVGVVRFDIQDEIAEVSIYLVPDSGNKGLGRGLLSEAEVWIKEHHPNLLGIQATVLPQNIPSKRLFESMQYAHKDDANLINFFKKI